MNIPIIFINSMDKNRKSIFSRVMRKVLKIISSSRLILDILKSKAEIFLAMYKKRKTLEIANAKLKRRLKG